MGGRGAYNQKNSMAGRITREIKIADGEELTELGKYTGREFPTDRAEKMIDIIKNAPVGTEITITGLADKNKSYKEEYRITGTLRNKILEPKGNYTHSLVDRGIGGELSDTQVILDLLASPRDSYYGDYSRTIRLTKTPKTVAEKKAQQEESNAERRQLKLFR